MICLTILGISVYFLGLIIFFYYLFTFFFFQGWKNPPYFPSMGNIRKRLLKEAEKYLKATQKLNVGDLGCGDGRLLKPLAKKYPHHQFYGYEWDKIPFGIAKFYLKKQKSVQLIQGDFFNKNLKHLDLIVCYLGSRALGQKLEKKLKKGCIILSAVFEIEGWTPIQIIHSDLYGLKTKIFVYQI